MEYKVGWSVSLKWDHDPRIKLLFYSFDNSLSCRLSCYIYKRINMSWSLRELKSEQVGVSSRSTPHLDTLRHRSENYAGVGPIILSLFFTYDLTLRDFLRRQHDASPQYPWTFNSGKLSAAVNSPKVTGNIWSREVRHVTDTIVLIMSPISTQSYSRLNLIPSSFIINFSIINKGIIA